MTVTIDLSPDESRRLQARAAEIGQDTTAYLRRLIREALDAEPTPTNRTFAEILAPVHDAYDESGMTEAERDTVLSEALEEARAERRRGKTSSA